eukprot:m.117914 g.117914  ORF g.117914 m.117914 type:complete len:188 (-) comp14266_c0_seq4:616-1179(-)
MASVLDGSAAHFTTQRLVVQAIAGINDDRSTVEGLSTILSKEVTEFLPPSLHYDTQKENNTSASAAWLRALMKDGGRVYTVSSQDHVKRNTALLGLLTCFIDQESNPSAVQIRIGYLFGKQYWGKGYATELVRGFVDALVADNFKGEVVGGVEVGNGASATVLSKAGFEKDDTQSNLEVGIYCRKFQ